MLEAIALLIADSSLTAWIQQTYWIWPVLEITHFIGLSLLLGGLIIIDLRLAGHFQAIPLSATHQLLPMVLLGFSLNLLTGILFFFGEPVQYSINIGFQIKMILVVLAGLNAFFYAWKIRPLVQNLDIDSPTPPVAKLVAYSSLALWGGVLICGRLLPYLGMGG